MARTSKRKPEVSGREAGEHQKRMYSVGIYARLSADSDERKNESIETQIAIAREFIGRQSDMTVYDCYTDVGKTGTGFERKGFQRMMGDVRARRIDCVVVKDLSRFGRNHIETGNYLEKIFPFMGVRFIAVTDHFDSRNVSGQNEALSVNLKNLVNEMYARDIAMKVRSGRKAQWERGSYTGGVPPYGYRAERAGDKKCLLVEAGTSDIVRKIFELFLAGSSRKQIVQWLYENRIVRPSVYHKTGRIYSEAGEQPEQWSGETVKMILTNPVYTGCLVHGCTCGKDDGKGRGREADSNDRQVKEHTHEAIICEELFFQAAERFEKASRHCNKDKSVQKASGEEDIFARVLYCGVCGSKMKRVSAVKTFRSKHRIRIYSYRCPKAGRIDGFRCSCESITLHSLTNLVKKAVRQESSLSALNPGKLAERKEQEGRRQKEEWHRQLAGLEKQRERITRLGSEQYYRYRMGEIDENRFLRAKGENEKNISALRKQSEAISEKLRETDSRIAAQSRFLCAVMRGSEKSRLTAEAVEALIHRIEIYPDHRVRVVFAFQRRKCPPAVRMHRGEEGIG